MNFLQSIARCLTPLLLTLLVSLIVTESATSVVQAAPLRAGVAKIDITNTDVPLVNDTLYAKALAIKSDDKTVVFVTIDAVAIAEIGSIKNSFLGNVRAQLQKDIGLDPTSLVINASHCHGVVCSDIQQRTVKVVKAALKNLVPVDVGVGSGHEDRIMENRRLKLKSGREADVRHAYSLPTDDEVVGIGPIDPEIGIMRLNRKDGTTLAVVFQFACHPIQGVPNGGNTADISGFASRVIEDNLSEGTVALFLQGCGGDINPVQYKDVNNPRDAEPLGNLLGLSVLKALRKISVKPATHFGLINEKLVLPRADLAERIDLLESQTQSLLRSLAGTSLNLKTFLPLAVKYNLANDFPSYYSHRYMHEKLIGRNDLSRLDAENRSNMQRYIRNIVTMERLSRNQINLRLLKKHQARNVAAGRTIEVETVGVRVGDFVLITFPGELVVQIGLNIKKRSTHKHTFVSGYTNGYIYYSPTAEHLRNVGGAQEDSDCLLAPEWQALFETRAESLLKRLTAR